MPIFMTRDEFIPWETDLMDDFPERAVFWDPKIDRACMVYWRLEGKSSSIIAKEYAVSEGTDQNGEEIIFKYSIEEKGPFQGVTTLLEFRERCDDLLDQTDEMLNSPRLKN